MQREGKHFLESKDQNAFSPLIYKGYRPVLPYRHFLTVKGRFYDEHHFSGFTGW